MTKDRKEKITCNGGYCQYKYQAGSLLGCAYEGYCDYQCPKDSREENKTNG